MDRNLPMKQIAWSIFDIPVVHYSCVVSGFIEESKFQAKYSNIHNTCELEHEIVLAKEKLESIRGDIIGLENMRFVLENSDTGSTNLKGSQLGHGEIFMHAKQGKLVDDVHDQVCSVPEETDE